MIKQAMSAAGLEVLAVGGLLIFVGVFVGIGLWVTTRSRKEVEKWSSLPLADGKDPVEPRLPITTPVARGDADDYHPDHKHAGGGYGKRVDCSCKDEELVTVTSLTTN